MGGLPNHILDKYEHLVRYYGDYSNSSHGSSLTKVTIMSN
jgi:hypothetical protein